MTLENATKFRNENKKLGVDKTNHSDLEIIDCVITPHPRDDAKTFINFQIEYLKNRDSGYTNEKLIERHKSNAYCVYVILKDSKGEIWWECISESI